jgi:hypothetical protein
MFRRSLGNLSLIGRAIATVVGFVPVQGQAELLGRL